MLAESIGKGLKRRSITKCSTWSERYRVMGQPYPGLWSFKYHPWAREMHDCQDDMIVGQKAAQMGYTETALNRVFYAIDVLGESVLYVLPASTPDASDFSAMRFDPALEASSHLANMFSDVKNVGHKRAGSASLLIRGSRSRGQMKSAPTGTMIFDEVDEMVQENIPLAFERMSGQKKKSAFLLSTATIENYGINAYFRKSSQDHFFFACPFCSKQTELIFPECVEVTGEDPDDPAILNSRLLCKECKHTLDHETKHEWLKDGKWVASQEGRMSRGFYINQLYSSTIPPHLIAASFLRGRDNPADEQEFYNSKLGVPHAVEGARVTDAQIIACTKGTKKLDGYSGGKLITMGVDVGKWLHVEITEWTFEKTVGQNDVNLMAHARVIYEGKVLNFEELDNFMVTYKVSSCVIDANPEQRKALEFAQRFWGHVKRCFYGNGVSGKQVSLHAEDQHSVTVDRTSWLDLSLGRFKRGAITLPIDVSMEYRENTKALVRIYEKDANGNPVGRYVRGNDDDHYAHARNYSEIALQLGANMSKATTINGDIL